MINNLLAQQIFEPLYPFLVRIDFHLNELWFDIPNNLQLNQTIIDAYFIAYKIAFIERGLNRFEGVLRTTELLFLFMDLWKTKESNPNLVISASRGKEYDGTQVI